ncbi:hypothetical protein D1871_20540, partial [Nakamurella silvestris]
MKPFVSAVLGVVITSAVLAMSGADGDPIEVRGGDPGRADTWLVGVTDGESSVSNSDLGSADPSQTVPSDHVDSDISEPAGAAQTCA